MKIRSLAAAFVATNLIALAGAFPLFAQQPLQGNNGSGVARPPFNGGGQPGNAGPAAAPTRPSAPLGPVGPVALVDMQEVFKYHTKFKAAIEGLKLEIQRIETDALVKQKAGQKKAEQLRDLAPGTPDFKRLEEDVAHLHSDFQVEMQLKQKDMADREAKIYYSTYLEVQDIIKEYALRNDVRLVLRYNRVEMDPQKRDTIMQGIQRPVVYEKGLDVTDIIIAQVNRGVPTGPAAGQTNQALRPQLPPRGNSNLK